MRDFQRGFRDGPVKKWKAVCKDCGAECEVPFEPTPGKAVRCTDCHRKHRGF